jgi:hypothetical protein
MIKIVGVISDTPSSEIEVMRQIPEIVNDPEYIKLATSHVEPTTQFFQRKEQIIGGLDLKGAELRDFQAEVALKRFPTESLAEIASRSGTGALKADKYGEAVPDIGRDTPGKIKGSQVLSSNLQGLVQGPFHVSAQNWLYSDAQGVRIRETIPYNWDAYKTVGERILGGKRNFESFAEIAKGNISIDNIDKGLLEKSRDLHRQIEVQAKEFYIVMADIEEVVNRQQLGKDGKSINIPDPKTGKAPYKSESAPKPRQVDIEDYFAGKYTGAIYRDVGSAKAVSTRTKDYTKIAVQHNLPEKRPMTTDILGPKPSVLDVEHELIDDKIVPTREGESDLRKVQSNWFKKREELRVANLKTKGSSKSFTGELKDPRVIGGVIGIGRILRGGGSGLKK